MNLNLLQTFVMVAREGGFRNAAEKHFLTPSAVSSRIRLLEEEIGAQLFERGQFGTRLTLSGQRLLDNAEDMLAAWNRVRRDAAIPAKARQILAIGATDTIWQSLLMGAVSSMHVNDPMLALRMETGTAESLTRDVLDGTLDAVCLFDPPLLPVLKAEMVGEVPLILVSTHPAPSVEKVFSGDFIQIEWGRADGALQAQIPDSVSASMIRTSVGWLGLQWLLQQGGSAYLPESLAEPYLQTSKLFRVPDAPVLKRTVHLIYPVQSVESHPETAKLMLGLADCIKQDTLRHFSR